MDEKSSPEVTWDEGIQALEAVKLVSNEYGIPTGDLKTCIAYVLDGNFAGSRRKTAFVLAMELRRLGWERDVIEATLFGWAQKVGIKPNDVRSAVKSAFQKTANGEYKYRSPGLRNTGSTYQEVLAPICDAVGCPSNCPAFSGKFQGQTRETFERFEHLGWLVYLRRRRLRGAIDLYHGICLREKQLTFAPGAPLYTTYKQLGAISGLHFTSVGDSLRKLADLGLIKFEPGHGAGPHAHDRVASRITRVVPIPQPPRVSASTTPITTGSGSQPDIGRATQQRAIQSGIPLLLAQAVAEDHNPAGAGEDRVPAASA